MKHLITFEQYNNDVRFVQVNDIESEYDFFHISTNFLEDVFEFTPRIPTMPFADINGDIIEDNFTKRISLASNIKNCLDAITDEDVDGYYIYGIKKINMDNSKLVDLSAIKCPVSYGEFFLLSDYIEENELDEVYNVGDLPKEHKMKFYACVPDVTKTNEFWYLDKLDMEYLGEIIPWKYGVEKIVV